MKEQKSGNDISHWIKIGEYVCDASEIYNFMTWQGYNLTNSPDTYTNLKIHFKDGSEIQISRMNRDFSDFVEYFKKVKGIKNFEFETD